jgi:hypothetical protein
MKGVHMEVNLPKLSAQGLYTILTWIIALVLNLTRYHAVVTDIVTAISGLVTAAHVHGLHLQRSKNTSTNPRA